MPFNGSGTYNKPSNTFSPASSATTISSADWNTTHTDLATALSNVICKDGQTTVTANLPMATKRHTGVGDAQALTDYASANQVVDGALTYLGASSAGTDTYAVTAAISPGTLVTGAKYVFKADVANTGACTLNVSGIGATAIKTLDGGDPTNGAIGINQFVCVIYDGTNFVLQNSIKLDYLDIATLGTAEASKAVTTDASSDITGLNNVTSTTFTGNLTGNVTGNVTGDVTGNADTATNWASASTITLTGDVTASATNINGTTNASLSTSLATGSVAANELAADAVTDVAVYWESSGGTSVAAITSGTVIPAGLYTFFSPATDVYLDVQTSSTWRNSTQPFAGGAVFADGVGVRLRSSAGTVTVYARKLA